MPGSEPTLQSKATKEMHGMLFLYEAGLLKREQVIEFGQRIIQEYGPVDEAAGARFRAAITDV